MVQKPKPDTAAGRMGEEAKSGAIHGAEGTGHRGRGPCPLLMDFHDHY